MNLDSHAESLIEEIERYLQAVDAFRTAGYEPEWRREAHPEAGALVHRLAAYNEPASQPAA